MSKLTDKILQGSAVKNVDINGKKDHGKASGLNQFARVVENRLSFSRLSPKSIVHLNVIKRD